MDHLFSISADFDAADRMLSDLGRRQLPFATAMALNDTVDDGLKAVEREIEHKFSNPTRWTKRAFYRRRATKTRLEATIRRKDAQRGRHYLEVQRKGGVRPQTGLEKLVSSRLKYAGNIRTVTPASGARLNAHGNWSPSQRNQVLSAIKSQRAGSASAATKSGGKGRKRAGYFVPRRGSKLSPGVYQRMARGKVKKIVHFSPDVARYQGGFEFHSVVARVARRKFQDHFVKRLKFAIQTAK